MWIRIKVHELKQSNGTKPRASYTQTPEILSGLLLQINVLVFKVVVIAS